MIYRAVLLISLTAAILFVGALTTYPSPLVGPDATAKRSCESTIEMFSASCSQALMRTW